MFYCLVLTHRYGKDGQNSKKFEDKCLCFEIDFFKTLVNPNFIEKYKESLTTFVDLLNKYNKKGKFQKHRVGPSRKLLHPTFL